MQSMMMLLVLSSLLFATIGSPTFSPMYTIEVDVYIGTRTGTPETYRGNTRMYIGEGVDSVTGNYLDFFAGDAGIYPFAIRETIASREMELSHINYYFLDSPAAPDPFIRLSWMPTDLSCSIGAYIVDTIMADEFAKPIEMCSPYRFTISDRLDSLPYVGCRIDYHEDIEVLEYDYLFLARSGGHLIVTDIVQNREPTPNPTRTVLSVVRKAHPAGEQVQPISLLGRELKAISPGIFASPHALVLRIQRGL